MTVEQAARAVYDRFVRDLKDGYRTRDKEYAVMVLGKAFGEPTTVPDRRKA